MSEATRLPHELDACHQLIQQLSARVHEQAVQLEEREAQLAAHARDLESHQAFAQEQSRTSDELSQENAALKLTIEKLLNRLYGRRSERLLDAAGQMILGFGEDAEAAAEALAEAVLEAERTIEDVASRRRAKRKKRRESGDKKFPEHLPRYEVLVDLPEAEKAGKQLIGYDTVETLEFLRAELRVRQTKYAKYVDARNPQAGVQSPKRPSGLTAGNHYDTSIAVEIIAAKYFYHLPLYRQQDMFAGGGWTPSRSTLLNIMTAAEFILRPLVDYYRGLIDEIDILGCDETPVTLIVPPQLPELDPAHPRTSRITEVLNKALAEGRPSITARMWAYRSVNLPFNVFDFTVSRHRDGPDDILSGFHGKLMGDCWSGFQQIELRSHAHIERAACWSHARRKLHECRKNHPRHTTVLLGLIRQLYDLEDRAKLWSADERLALRQHESTRVLDQIREYLDGPELARVLPKSDLAEALGYLRNHWVALLVYTTDGRMPIDNNDVEQLMKQVALGRKNWLFVGSLEAGNRAANLMTLVSTAARNDLDVWAYLKDVLDQILAGSTDWESLRADHWKEQHPESVRTYRADERRDAVDRNQARRARRRVEQSQHK